jgi:hypothetical protein
VRHSVGNIPVFLLRVHPVLRKARIRRGGRPGLRGWHRAEGVKVAVDGGCLAPAVRVAAGGACLALGRS